MKGVHFLSFDDRMGSERRWLGLPRRALRRLAFSPPVRLRLEARYERHFATAQKANLFRGVYGNWEEAARSAPRTKAVGYDNPSSAGMYRDRLEHVSVADYPILFWLTRIMPGAKRLFDLGGHIGVRYYAFQPRLVLPDDLVWHVMDVPAVVRAGHDLAAERGVSALRFTDRREDLAGSDILYATGSLQYLERPLHEILGPIEPRPPHVLINLTPMQDGPAYYTLQSIGTAFCPYRIEDGPGLIAGMASLGYERVDAWDCSDKVCAIPFHPRRSIRGYRGMYFRARSSSPVRGVAPEPGA